MWVQSKVWKLVVLLIALLRSKTDQAEYDFKITASNAPVSFYLEATVITDLEERINDCWVFTFLKHVSTAVSLFHFEPFKRSDAIFHCLCYFLHGLDVSEKYGGVRFWRKANWSQLIELSLKKMNTIFLCGWGRRQDSSLFESYTRNLFWLMSVFEHSSSLSSTERC